MQRPSVPGPFRRWSPASLDPTMFDAGAEQSLASQYDYSRISRTTATTNAYHPYITQPEYTNYTQTAESSHYTHAASTSSGYQYANGLYPANNQPAYRIKVLKLIGLRRPTIITRRNHRSATARTQPIRMLPPPARQVAVNMHRKLSFNHQRNEPPGLSRLHLLLTLDDDASYHKASMASMMGRARLPIGGNAYIEAVPQSSGVGDKRKDRASSPPDTTRTAEASPVKKKKEALRVKGHRKNRTEATADLAKRLPNHLQVYETPSMKHIRQAIVHIDEQTARIGRLEDEASQLKAAQVQLVSEIRVLRRESATLLSENGFLRHVVEEKDTRIRQLEGGQTW
ncbi:hypothetical protein EWM64_g2767 [Hericium alpestre]|uniref:Uncharacterized protein n=1 Tax=Hericium alpestre TaxID=135208 RepID=A0A4Z0A491_9AGAM|nr:hypothetical protein EWM64_g2767 [Hericium alpestre]